MRHEANPDIIIIIIIIRWWWWWWWCQVYGTSQVRGKSHRFLQKAGFVWILFLGLPHGTEIPNLIGWVTTLNSTYIQILEAPPGTGLWEDMGWAHTTGRAHTLSQLCSQGRNMRNHPTGNSTHLRCDRGWTEQKRKQSCKKHWQLTTETVKAWPHICSF